VTIWPRKHKRKTPSHAFIRSKKTYRIRRSFKILRNGALQACYIFFISSWLWIRRMENSWKPSTNTQWLITTVGPPAIKKCSWTNGPKHSAGFMLKMLVEKQSTDNGRNWHRLYYTHLNIMQLSRICFIDIWSEWLPAVYSGHLPGFVSITGHFWTFVLYCEIIFIRCTFNFVYFVGVLIHE